MGLLDRVFGKKETPVKKRVVPSVPASGKKRKIARESLPKTRKTADENIAQNTANTAFAEVDKMDQDERKSVDEKRDSEEYEDGTGGGEKDPDEEKEEIPHVCHHKLNKEEIRDLCFDLFDKDYTVVDVLEYVQEKDIGDYEGKSIHIRSINGFKTAWLSQAPEPGEDDYYEDDSDEGEVGDEQYIPPPPRREPPANYQPNYNPRPNPRAYTPPPAYAQQPLQEYVPPPSPAPIPEQEKEPSWKPEIKIPQRKTKLEVFQEMFERGIETKNQALVDMGVKGIYAEMEKAEEQDFNNKMFTIFEGLVRGDINPANKAPPTPSKDFKADLRETLEILNEMGAIGNNQPNEMSEQAVVAGAIRDAATHISKDISDTVKVISGSKDVAETMGTCPSCSRVIPIDSALCPYCGQNFGAATAAPPKGPGLITDGGGRLVPESKPYNPEGEVMPKPMKQVKIDGKQYSEQDMKKMIHSLSNMISSRDNPVKKAWALWEVANPEQQRDVLIMAILGRERINKIASKMITDYPDLAHDFEICNSADGQKWIDAFLAKTKECAKEAGFEIPQRVFTERIGEIQTAIGIKIW